MRKWVVHKTKNVSLVIATLVLFLLKLGPA